MSWRFWKISWEFLGFAGGREGGSGNGVLGLGLTVDAFIMGTVKSFESRWVHKVGLSHRSVQFAGIKMSITLADGGE